MGGGPPVTGVGASIRVLVDLRQDHGRVTFFLRKAASQRTASKSDGVAHTVREGLGEEQEGGQEQEENEGASAPQFDLIVGRQYTEYTTLDTLAPKLVLAVARTRTQKSQSIPPFMCAACCLLLQARICCTIRPPSNRCCARSTISPPAAAAAAAVTATL